MKQKIVRTQWQNGPYYICEIINDDGTSGGYFVCGPEGPLEDIYAPGDLHLAKLKMNLLGNRANANQPRPPDLGDLGLE